MVRMIRNYEKQHHEIAFISLPERDCASVDSVLQPQVHYTADKHD